MAKSSSKQKKQSNKSSSAGMAANDSMLKSFFEDELKDIYWAEKHLTKALPKMKKAATSEELQHAFEEHLSVTEGHVARLEQVFDMLGKKAQEPVFVIAGITEACKKVEHHMMHETRLRCSHLLTKNSLIMQFGIYLSQ